MAKSGGNRRAVATAKHSGGSRRAVVESRRAAGTLIKTARINQAATRLKTVNAPTLAGHKHLAASATHVPGLKTVNAPGQKRMTSGGSAVHAVNAPRGQW